MTTDENNFPYHRTSPYSNKMLAESEVDRRARFPVMLLLGFSLVWLLVASVLGLMVSVQLHWAGFLEGISFLTHGRLRAAFHSAFLYGWASGAALAIGLWLVSRLSQSPLRCGLLFTNGVVFWNLGVLIGIVGILVGEMGPYRYLEMPPFTAPVLMVSYILIALPGVMAFYRRRTEYSYISQWFLVTALFGFPWIFSVAQTMLYYQPARGTVQSIVEAWYSFGLYSIWLAPVALAAFYYFVPKLLGVTVRYYYMARVAFWMYVVAALWPGVSKLAVGPVPAWVSSAGIMGHLVFLVPVLVIALNLLATLKQAPERQSGPTMRFLLVGMGVFIVVHVLNAPLALRFFQETIQFTHFQTAVTQTLHYGFVTMVFFGVIYFVVPRVVQRNWFSADFVKIHFWASAVGIALIVGSLAIGGWLQGARMNNPDFVFIDVARSVMPWLVLATFGWISLLVAHVAFAFNLVATTAFTARLPEEESEKLFYGKPPELKVQTS